MLKLVQTVGVIHKPVAEDIHNIIFDAGTVAIKNIDVVKMLVKVEQDWAEAIRHSAHPVMVTTLANAG